MPPALTGSMLSHAAQAASFNNGMHPTASQLAFHSQDLDARYIVCAAGDAGRFGKVGETRTCRLVPSMARSKSELLLTAASPLYRASDGSNHPAALDAAPGLHQRC